MRKTMASVALAVTTALGLVGGVETAEAEVLTISLSANDTLDNLGYLTAVYNSYTGVANVEATYIPYTTPVEPIPGNHASFYGVPVQLLSAAPHGFDLGYNFEILIGPPKGSSTPLADFFYTNSTGNRFDFTSFDTGLQGRSRLYGYTVDFASAGVISTVPLPSSAPLLGLGVLALGGLAYLGRRRSASSATAH